jgi:SNF2 family DNA or RNA helicase
MWLKKQLRKLVCRLLPPEQAGGSWQLKLLTPAARVATVSLEIRQPVTSGLSFPPQVETRFDHDANFSIEAAPVQTELIGCNIHGTRLIKAPKLYDLEVETKTSFDRHKRFAPILYPDLGADFKNPAALPGNKSLFPYQIPAAEFLIKNPSCVLADPMGSGKSIVAIVSMRVLFQKARICSALIVCPMSVVDQWERYLRDWAPELRITKIAGGKAERNRLWLRPSHVHLVGYETIAGDMKRKRFFDLIILDEVQKIKNSRIRLHKSISRVSAKFKWGLSGTPVENRLSEPISIFSYIKPGLLIENREKDVKAVSKAIAPYTLHRREEDVLPHLPPMLCEEIWVELTASQRDLYERTERTGVNDLKQLGREVTLTHALALITKLLQICNLNPINMESSKLDLLNQRLVEIDQDEKVLVFSQFSNLTLRKIQPLLKVGSLIYDGSTDPGERQKKIIEPFQKEKDYKALLISTRCGGLGLNLQNANHVYLFDSWWNPSVLEQATRRVRRIGQLKPVSVTYLYTKETVEEKVYKILIEKRKICEAFMGNLTSNPRDCHFKEEILGLLGISVKDRK